MEKFLINKKIIRKNSNDLYFIAEIGTNFVEYSKKFTEDRLVAIQNLIYHAKKSGASAVKFQVYKPETLVKNDHPNFDYFKNHSYWKLYFWKKVKEFCVTDKIDFILTIFDEGLVDELSPLVDGLKIASTDINNERLIKKNAVQGKPIIISSGASNFSEVVRAIDWCEEEGNSNVSVLHCVCNYPTEERNANLGSIRFLNYNLCNVIGYSDHSIGVTTILNAHLVGANIIEKHFTLDKNLQGNDHGHSLDSVDITNFFRHLDYNNKILGKTEKKPGHSELNEVYYGRRYLVYNKDVEYNKTIKDDDIKLIKLMPRDISGDLVKADEIDSVVGKKSPRDSKENEIVYKRDYE